jgi:hypothetical protein
VVGFDAHRAAELSIVELAFEGDAAFPSEESDAPESMALLMNQGVTIEPHPTDSCRIRITIPSSEASDA